MRTLVLISSKSRGSQVPGYGRDRNFDLTELANKNFAFYEYKPYDFASYKFSSDHSVISCYCKYVHENKNATSKNISIHCEMSQVNEVF